MAQAAGVEEWKNLGTRRQNCYPNDKEKLQTHNDHDNHKPKTETQRAPHLGHNRQVRHYIMTMTTMYDICETRLFIENTTEKIETCELTEMDRRRRNIKI